MPRPKPRADVQPRIWSTEQLAHRLNMSVGTFMKRLPDLCAAGLPLRDQLLDGYDSEAVELWLDRRAGIAPAAANQNRRKAVDLDDVEW